MADKTILTKLTLDNASFMKGLSESNKAVLGISASITALGAAALATAAYTAKWQDETIKAARSAGTTSEVFSSLAHAAQMSGVSAQDLTTSLAKLNTRSPETAKNFQSLGIQVKNANGSFKSSADLMSEVADVMVKYKNPADQAAIAMKAFGEEGKKMVSMLKDGSKGLQDAAAEAQKLGIVVSKEAAEAAEKFNDNMARSQLAMKGLTAAVGESIIEFVNQSGVMDAVRDTLSGLTEAWRGLSDSTRSTIVGLGATVVALAAVALAAGAIVAILPTIAAGFKALLGPVGLILAATAALAAGVFYLIRANRDQIEVAREQQAQAKKNYDGWVQNEQALKNLQGRTKLTATEQSELARVKEAVRKKASELGQAIDVETMSLQDLINKTREYQALEKAERLKAITKEANKLAEAYAQSQIRLEALAVQYKNASPEAYTAALNKELGTYNRLKSELSAVGTKYQELNKKVEETKKIFFGGGGEQKTPPEVLYTSDIIKSLQNVEVAKARYDGKDEAFMKAMQKRHIEEQKAATTSATQIAIAYANIAASIANAVSSVTRPVSDLMSTIASGSNYAAQVQMRNLEVEAIRSKKAYEEQRKNLEESEDLKIKTIEESYDAQIAAVTSAEEAKNRAIEKASNERLLMLDTEYQAEKARREAEFAKYMEDEAARYEIEKELILQKAVDKEQRMLNEDVMDATFKEQMKARQAAFDEEMAGLAKGYADKGKAIDDKAKNDLKLNEMSSKEQLKKLSDEKSKALQAAEADKNSKLAVLDQARSAQEKEEEKKRLQVQYDAQVQEFEQMKAVKTVEATAAGIAAAAMAFASLAPIPFVGPALGAAAAAVILSTTAMRVGQINSQRPVKPAGLIAETGGLISGPRHSGGGVDVNAEGGELIFDRGRTAKLFDAVDSGSMGGIHITIAEGAFQGVSEEDLPEKVSQWIGVELRRQGIAAA